MQEELLRGRDLRDVLMRHSRLQGAAEQQEMKKMWDAAAQFFTRNGTANVAESLKRIIKKRDRDEILMKIQAKKLREAMSRAQAYRDLLKRVKRLMGGAEF